MIYSCIDGGYVYLQWHLVLEVDKDKPVKHPEISDLGAGGSVKVIAGRDMMDLRYLRFRFYVIHNNYVFTAVCKIFWVYHLCTTAN